MPTDNTDLQEDNNPANLDATGNGAAQGAGDKAPEDTQGSGVDFSAIIEAQRKTIEQQQATISEALEQVSSLNKQIAEYVRSVGSPAPDGQAPDDGTKTPDSRIPEDYTYLKDLGKEIGKR